MRKTGRGSGLSVLSLFLMCVALAAVAAGKPQDTGQNAQQSGSNPPAGAAAQTPAPVDAETCKLCHEDNYDSWANSPHWKTTLNTRGGPTLQGCETCHAPGAAHVGDPANKAKFPFTFDNATPQDINARCLTCHASGRNQMHLTESVHRQSDVSCVSCHSIHHSETKEYMLIKAQPELCYTCHLQQRAQFNMPFHHRVNEHLVRCTDCHNPHGTAGPKQLRASATQSVVCYTCHEDKQGPFVYEHEPVKTEGCVMCHTPHGGPNPHMLKTSNVNLLCLSCHTVSFTNAPGPIGPAHNQAAQYQACTLCHNQIHGSNFSSVFFK
ncbi:MAG: DmsE family decaheme c-type cytochrome [Candidatus Acidiferrales bacterium]